jgi:hypothetical protein
MSAELISWGWLRRELRVDMPDGSFRVVYSGRGMGFETVYVDDFVAERATNLLWFVPVFVFPLGRRLGVVEVRVWPWLTLRSFHLLVDGNVLYAEGERSPANVPPAWVQEICRRWEATGRVNPEVTEKMPSLLTPNAGIRRASDGAGSEDPTRLRDRL